MSVCPFVRRPSIRPCVRKLAPIPAVVSQNVTNKSCLVCVMSEKYAFWVTLRLLGSILQGKVELHTLHYYSFISIKRTVLLNVLFEIQTVRLIKHLYQTYCLLNRKLENLEIF